MFPLLSSLLIFFSFLFSFSLTEDFVGCFFSQQLCEKNEFCFDDNAFGKCSSNEIPEKLLFTEDQLERLETEMTRLFLLGFRWDHPYTQCIVKQLLIPSPSLFDPGLCLRHSNSHSSENPASVHFQPPSRSNFARESFERPLRTDTKKAGPKRDEQQEQQQTLQVDSTQTFVSFRERGNGEKFVIILEQLLNLPRGTFSNIRTGHAQVTFKVNPNPKGENASSVANNIESMREVLQRKSGLEIKETGVGADEVNRLQITKDNEQLRKVTIIAAAGFVALLLLSLLALLFSRRKKLGKEVDQQKEEEQKVDTLYQELCRQRMQSEGNRMKEELDIGTGHLVLQVMEEYAKEDGERLKREWDNLIQYEAEGETRAGAEHMDRNRFNDVLPFDHSRILLNDLENVDGKDYINASAIIDHDPRNATYILTQGPLHNTLSDFWQMIFEQSVVVIVNLTRLQENGVEQCFKYWPDSGSKLYGKFEVHLVSEHIWSDDFLVRSFYLKNLKTAETRTVSQFHFLSWPNDGLPPDIRAFLDFRRKVNKSFRGRCSPIVVHCSDGVGRSGCFCLLDMVLNRVVRGAKEIDLEATLEHIRDQRGGAVRTRAQYEFVLKCLAEEIQNFLK